MAGRSRRSRFSVLCPRCRAETEVKGTFRDGRASVLRDRACTNCRAAFRTKEKVVASTIRERREPVYPLGDQLDQPFGIVGGTLTVRPAGQGTRWRNAGGFRLG